jgi:hypothetical protein
MVKLKLSQTDATGEVDAARGERRDAYAALPVNTKGIVCPHTGLRHAHLAKLLKPGGMAAAYVRVVKLREPGAKQGKTLFHIGDMLKWLDDLAAQQASEGSDASKRK